MNLIRAEAGFFSDYEVYVFVVLLFSNKFNIEINKKRKTFFLIVIGFSIFMYLARTNFLQIAILVLGIKGYFVLTQKSLKVLSLVVFSFLLSYGAIYYANPKRNGKGIEALMYKIKIAPEEAFKTKINKEDWKDFNDNYRSFENIITVKQVTADGLRAVFFGKGIGSTLNIGQKIKTTDGSIIQYISVAHNGFMTIFMKSGLLGLLLLLFILYLLYKQKRDENPLINHLNMLLMGTSVFLVLSTWVFMGVYFKLDNKSIIIGLILAMREYLIKANNGHLLK
jgi:O-antigen ligase